jgi:6-phosphogluconolactonase
MIPQVIRTKNFVGDAVNYVLNVASQAIGDRGEFRIALSGGNTPRPIYSQLARLGDQAIPWETTTITFSDERCVPPDHEQSNYRMARETLLEPAHVSETSVLRMRGEIDPQMAAQEYQAQLNELAKKRGEQIYRHDLVLLGLGDDGHTASLFPGTQALDEKYRQVAANFVPKFKSWRLTFTFPLINQGRHVCFLVNSNKHGDLIERVLAGDQQYPAARVNPIDGQLTWIIGE